MSENKEVTVYIQETCVHCHRQLEWMNQNNIDFEKKDVSREKNKEEFINLGGRGTPYTIVTDQNGNQEKIQGFQREHLENLILF
ncbi:glutaredoxin [Salibacterium salarium]|uniref:glutaredoxin family protein n=1 Tax=Salibacterium salarium TaxID=284579 RepID=UPI0027876FE0|nr:glutaredoxin family protein [Salibacterium salarium]MDQ0297730.1 glutaredoxin [Salibacterium salarium]